MNPKHVPLPPAPSYPLRLRIRTVEFHADEVPVEADVAHVADVLKESARRSRSLEEEADVKTEVHLERGEKQPSSPGEGDSVPRVACKP